ncbi:hypothetical protein EC973_008396, partial [Apophysomyces ossiformis]
MTRTDEQRRLSGFDPQTLEFLYHGSDVLQQRLKELRERKRESANTRCEYEKQMFLLDDMVKQTNAHIRFIRNSPSLLQEDKDGISLNMTELKFAILEYQSACNVEILNTKLEKMAQKYNTKSKICKELEAKLQCLESKIVESHQSKEKIYLTSPLVVAAKLTGAEQKTRCFVFDKGYTTYHDLYKKIQEIFSLATFTVQVKYDREANEAKTISTADDYKEVIGVMIKDGKSDEPVHIMEIYVETGEEQDASKTNSDNEGASDIDSEEFINLREQDFALILPKADAKFNEVEKETTNHY